MYRTLFRMMFWLLIPAIIFGIADLSMGATAGDAVIEPRPIVFEPEPVGNLHPKLKWIKTQRIRALWGAENLYDQYGKTDKSKAQVMTESGFNVALISMQNDQQNRSFVPGFDDVLPSNIKEARKYGLALWVKWRYGSDHQEPYHRYRPPYGE